MTDEPFEKLDQDFMERLKTEREKGVSPEILKGFSASVQARILEKEAKKEKKSFHAREASRILVPAFAVILLALVAVFRKPSFYMSPPRPMMGIMLTSATDLSDEISALEELGGWSDEDEKILDIPDPVLE